MMQLFVMQDDVLFAIPGMATERLVVVYRCCLLSICS